MQRINVANTNIKYVLILSGILIAAVIGLFLGFNGVSKYVVLGFLGVAYVILTIMRPWIAVAVFFAVVPLDTLFVFQGSITATMTKMAGAYLMLLVFLTGSLRYIHDVFSSRKVLVMILFGAAAVISVMTSEKIYFSLPFLLTLSLSIILCFVLILLVRDTRTLYLATWALLLGGLISVISPIFFNVGRAQGYELMRYGGLWGDQNEFAALLLVMIPLAALNIIISRGKILKLVSIAISVILTIGVVMTYSRGGFLALCVMTVLAIFKLSTGRNRIKMLAITIPCMVIAFALIYYFFSEEIITRMETLSVLSNKESVAKDEALSLRYNAYFVIVPKVFSEHPILGVGLRQFIFKNPYHIYTHNTFLEVLTGTGLVGFIPFVLILFFTWKELRTVQKYRGDKGFYLRSYANALEIGYLGFLFAGLFVSMEQNKMLWLTISIAAVLFNLYKMQVRAEYDSKPGSRNMGYYHQRRPIDLNR